MSDKSMHIEDKDGEAFVDSNMAEDRCCYLMCGRRLDVEVSVYVQGGVKNSTRHNT